MAHDFAVIFFYLFDVEEDFSDNQRVSHEMLAKVAEAQSKNWQLVMYICIRLNWHIYHVNVHDLK